MLSEPTTEGMKFDDGKTPLDLWSPDAMIATANVLGYGAAKYNAHNWTVGIRYRRIFSALLRHLWAWWRGQQIDEESGHHHLAHAMCCLMFLLHYEMNRGRYAELDDRHRYDED